MTLSLHSNPHQSSQPWSLLQSFCITSNMISLTRLFVPPVRMKVAPATMSGRFSMSASCSSLRTSSMKVRKKILLTLPAQEEATKDDVLGDYKWLQDHRFYDLEKKKIVTSDEPSAKLDRNSRIVGSSHGWLAFLEPSDCSLSLKKPSTTTSTGVSLYLPPIETLPVFTGKIYRQADMDKPGVHGYDVAGFTYQGPDGKERFETSEKLSEYFVDKLMLTSEPTSEDCVVVKTTRSVKSKLACCRPGDLKWKTLDTGCCSGDVVYNPIDHKFYAIRNKSNLEIEIWDLKGS